MSFIGNLQQQQRNSVATPAVVPRYIAPEPQVDGLAATFRDPNRFNAPLNRQFSIPTPAMSRQQLTPQYRG